MRGFLTGAGSMAICLVLLPDHPVAATFAALGSTIIISALLTGALMIRWR